MGFFSSLKKSVAGGLDTLSAIYSHPKTTLTGIAKLALPSTRQEGAEAVMGAIKKTKKEGAGKTIVRTVTHTAIASATLLGAGTVAGRAVVAKILIPTTVKGVIKTAGVVALGAGALSTSQTVRSVASDPAKIPELAFGGGQIVGKAIEGEALPDIKQALITGGLVGAGVVAGVGVVAVGKKLLDKAPSIITPREQLITEKPLGVAESPILPETQTITTGKKTYKRRTAKKMPSVRQSVRVQVLNRPVNTGIRITNKKYLNQELLN